jgi:hypothetical protein
LEQGKDNILYDKQSTATFRYLALLFGLLSFLKKASHIASSPTCRKEIDSSPAREKRKRKKKKMITTRIATMNEKNNNKNKRAKREAYQGPCTSWRQK